MITKGERTAIGKNKKDNLHSDTYIHRQPYKNTDAFTSLSTPTYVHEQYRHFA